MTSTRNTLNFMSTIHHECDIALSTNARTVKCILKSVRDRYSFNYTFLTMISVKGYYTPYYSGVKRKYQDEKTAIVK
jgi:hypothetical protein